MVDLSSMNAGTTPLRFMPQLDGLRAVAVFLVVFAHFMPGNHPLLAIFNWGRFGVLLFFVLSGYLITTILLRYNDTLGMGHTLRSFYARRFLRLMPIYLLFLFVQVAIDRLPLQDLGWYLFYTQNFARGFAGVDHSLTGHLWSLAVEEQFYLLWPAIVFSMPRRRLPQILFWGIALAVCYRLAVTVALWPVTDPIPWALKAHLPLFGCLDTLALGSLLAVIIGNVKLSRRLLGLALPAAILVLALSPQQVLNSPLWLIQQVSFDLLAGLVCVWLVYMGSRNRLGGFWAWRPICHIGKVSYGVYLYHVMFALWFRTNSESTLAECIATVMIVFTFSVLAASVSWYYIEAPINRLKRLFPYARTPLLIPTQT